MMSSHLSSKTKVQKFLSFYYLQILMAIPTPTRMTGWMRPWVQVSWSAWVMGIKINWLRTWTRTALKLRIKAGITEKLEKQISV